MYKCTRGTLALSLVEMSTYDFADIAPSSTHNLRAGSWFSEPKQWLTGILIAFKARASEPMPVQSDPTLRMPTDAFSFGGRAWDVEEQLELDCPSSCRPVGQVDCRSSCRLVGHVDCPAGCCLDRQVDCPSCRLERPLNRPSCRLERPLALALAFGFGLGLGLIIIETGMAPTTAALRLTCSLAMVLRMMIIVT